MNRIEFMTELAALLQDIPAVERQEAMKYYNDYFDDAGKENEQQVIRELESPAKIAATIKAGLGMPGTENQDGNYGEFRETGYRDTRFEKKDVPVNPAPQKTDSVFKLLFIIAIIIIGAPVLIPVAISLLAVVFAGVLAVFVFFAAIVIAFVAIAVIGVVLFCAGIVALIPEIAVGLGLMGTGLVISVLGVIGTVVSVRICMIVFSGVIRGIISFFGRILHRRAVT